MSNAVLCVCCKKWKLPEKMRRINKRLRAYDGGRTGFCWDCDNEQTRIRRNRIKNENPEQHARITAARRERRKRQLANMSPEELEKYYEKCRAQNRRYSRNMTFRQKQLKHDRNQRYYYKLKREGKLTPQDTWYYKLRERDPESYSNYLAERRDIKKHTKLSQKLDELLKRKTQNEEND